MVKDAYRRCNHIRARVCVSVCFEQLNPTDWIQWQQWVGSLVGSMEGWGGPISINGVSFFFLSFLIDIYIYIFCTEGEKWVSYQVWLSWGWRYANEMGNHEIMKSWSGTWNWSWGRFAGAIDVVCIEKYDWDVEWQRWCWHSGRSWLNLTSSWSLVACWRWANRAAAGSPSLENRPRFFIGIECFECELCWRHTGLHWGAESDRVAIDFPADFSHQSWWLQEAPPRRP